MSPNQLELAVIIPVYNEEAIIQKVIADWIQELRMLKINFILAVYNDGSSDKTLIKLKELNYPELKIIDKKNSGHGPTIVQGYIEHLYADWLFQVDSDDELRVHEFKQFWEMRDKYDLIIGHRIDREGPAMRKLMTKVSSVLVRIMYAPGISDTNIPYRLIKTSSFKKYYGRLEKLFAPNIVLSGIALHAQMAVKEIPVHFYPRQTGEVSIKRWKLLKVAIKSFWQTFAFRIFEL